MSRAVADAANADERDARAVAERLARLIRIPTVSGGAAPAGDDVFRAFRDELADCYPLAHAAMSVERVGPRGLLFRWQPDADARESAGAPIEQADRPLVLMAHADVVPADAADGWAHPPFAGTIADGAVHGRGALDDKGPLVAVFEAVESLVAEGFRPLRPLIISLGGDEETLGSGGADAADAVARAGAEPLLVLDEGGAVIEAPLPVVRGATAMIGVAEKGFATLRLSAHAEPGHASTPSGGSAPSRIARAVTRLERHRSRARLTPAVRAMLVALSSRAPGPVRLALRVLARTPWLTPHLFAAVGGEPAALVRTTCAVTMLAGGTAPNVIAADASAIVNLRIVPGETVRGTERRVRRVIRDRRVTVERLTGADPTPVAPVHSTAFAALRGALAASYPDAIAVPYLVMATTDARHFQRRWPNVYRFAPVRMSVAQRASIHGVDEHVTIDALERGIRFHRALIRDTLGNHGTATDAGARVP